MVIALICALAWWFKRSLAARPLRVALGLLFIINQGYWEETTETLALVLASTLVCMAIGVPIGISAPIALGLRLARPVLDLMQTMPTFVYLIPTHHPVRPRHGAGPDRDRHLRRFRRRSG